MTEWQRRIVGAVSAVALLIVVYAILYQWALLTFEGVETTFFNSLQIVTEALTTAGFGADTEHWNTPLMNLFVVAMNLTGVLLVFLALPLVVVPLFQEALKDSPQKSTDLTDHVIICSYSSREDVLRSELEAADVPYVIIDTDPETVLELNDVGIEAIWGDPEQEETFRDANIEKAGALVADVSDEENVSVILTARELREDLTIVSVAEDENEAEYHRFAGADRVIRPRQVLGQALANKATLSLTRKLRETVELGEDFEISELLVKADCELAGQTLAELDLQEQIGATVIGMWSNGEFISVPGPDTRVDENTILLVAGSHRAIEQVRSRTISPNAPDTDRVVVVGYGVVGKATVKMLDSNGISHTVMDMKDDDAVDISGDVNDRETLSEAGIENARFVVLALDDDTTTMYTTVAIEEHAPDTDVITRVNDVQNMAKLYRAGAEYVLALSTVSGRMLSSVLLEDEEILTPGTQFEIIRTTAPKLAGKTLQEAAVRERTGATIAAIERNGELLTNPGADSLVERGDKLVITGSDDAVNRFIETFK